MHNRKELTPEERQLRYVDIIARARAQVVSNLASYLYHAENHGYELEPLMRDALHRCKQMREEDHDRLLDEEHSR